MVIFHSIIMSTKSSEQKLNRDDIIAAVAHLIADQGLESLTMRNIARHVGCSVGTLPHYFEGKDDIVVAALNWSSERILNRLTSMPAADTRLDNLYPLLSASMPTDEQSDTEWRVRLCLWDYAVTNNEMRSSVNVIASAAIETLTTLVKKLQDNNEINKIYEPKTTALTLYHMCIGSGFNMLHTPMEKRSEQLQSLFSYIDSIKA
jgi:AcrR family transcriptional regulator